MVLRSKKEYLKAIRQRYRESRREEKTAILNEFCAVCGYNRKYAIRLLRRRTDAVIKRKPGPASVYKDEAIIKALKRIWLASEQMCSKKLKAAIPLWLPSYQEEYGNISGSETKKLLAISSATIDRLLKPYRAAYIKGKTGTRPGTMLKKHIPIKTTNWDVTQPGFIEADTVAHCGNSLEGQFVWSLTYTDIMSGWTENRAVWGRGAINVIEQTKDVESRLIFPILGFDCDNGSEFLNYHLVRYFTDRPIAPVSFTRSRPYHKNDNAFVEQKNWTHVRQLLGYERFDKRELMPVINDLYANEWSLFNNFFRPNMKLIKKIRVNSKYVKYYDKPKTSCQRLIESSLISDDAKSYLRNTLVSLNPFSLKKQIEIKLRIIFNTLKGTSL